LVYYNILMNKIILATNNPHKQEKLGWIVKGYFTEIENLNEKIKVEENGKTFKENAEIKALFIAKKHKCFAIATDGGVLIPALGNNWNELLTRRFIGNHDATDTERMDTLLELMKDKKNNQRKIIWKEAIALANEKGILFSVEVEGDWGYLQESYNPKQYKEGIWIASLWSYPQFGGKNFFDLSNEEQKYGEKSWWDLRKKTRIFLKSSNGVNF
jgi:XTP/dITP diphosphohydrolase